MRNIVGDNLRVIVKKITNVAENIKRFDLVPKDGGILPIFASGTHIVVEMQDGDIVRRNPYSLMGDSSNTSSYSISVLRLEDGRGGSKFMHDAVKENTELTISYPFNLFALDLRAKKHLLIAGGIGITPLMSHADELMKHMQPFELHYSTRSINRAAYKDFLESKYQDRFNFYVSSGVDGRGGKDENYTSWDIHDLLIRQPAGTHVYTCGPAALIDQVTQTCEKLGWGDANVHVERFLAPPSGKPYTVELSLSNKIVKVGEHSSMLEAIEMAGVDHPHMCRGGVCGQCETNVVSVSGKITHNDHFLSDEEKTSGKKIMPCVSRIEGENPKIVLER